VPRIINADVPLAPDGVLIFALDAGSQPPAPETIAVVDARGDVIEGAIETPADGDRVITTVNPDLWIWRPAAPLPPAARYTATLRNTFTSESATFAFETSSEGATAIDLEALFTLALHGVPIDFIPPTECCERDDGVMPSCFSPDLLLMPQLRVGIDATDPSPAVRQLLFAARGDVEHAWNTTFSFGDRTRIIPGITFYDRLTEYCAELEVFDARTRTLTQLPPRCAPHQGSLFEETVPKTQAELSSMLAANFCNRPPAGFEAAWCEANAGTCFLRDAPGCQHFEALCPDRPREPEPVEPVTGGSGLLAKPEPDGGADEGSSAGCSALRQAPSHSVFAAWLLVLLALRRRDRRDRRLRP
jgi:hypothetical protein